MFLYRLQLHRPVLDLPVRVLPGLRQGLLGRDFVPAAPPGGAGLPEAGGQLRRAVQGVAALLQLSVSFVTENLT